jgi:hypothetical protein
MGEKGRKFLTIPEQRAILVSLSAEPVHGCFAGRSTAGKTQIRDTRKRDD